MGVQVKFLNAHFFDVIGELSLPVIDYTTGRFTSANPIGVEQVQDSTKVCSIVSPDGGDIYYTTDGSTPSTGSTKYTQPFTITGNETIKAVAYKDGIYSGVSSVDTSKVIINVNKKVSVSSSNQGYGETFSVKQGYVTDELYFGKIVITSDTAIEGNFNINYKNSNSTKMVAYPMSLIPYNLVKGENIGYYGNDNLVSNTYLTVMPFVNGSTVYAKIGEATVEVNHKVIKLTKTQVGSAVSKTSVGTTEQTLFSGLDYTKKYGVKCVITNATPTGTAINALLRDKRTPGYAAGGRQMGANGTYCIPVELDSTHTAITCQCYSGTCDIEATLYELTE